MKFTQYFILLILLFGWISNGLVAQNAHAGKHHKKQEMVSQCPLIDSIIDFAKTKLGCAYASGGTGPRAFDCSGFMFYTFQHFNIQLGRSSRDQFLMGRKIEKNNVQPGDLVFWYRGKGYIGHVGMVVSVDSAHNFKFIHSATHGKGVRYDYSNRNWYASTYAGARRVIECDGQGHASLIAAEGKSVVLENTTPIAEDTVKATQQVPTDSVKIVENSKSQPAPVKPAYKTIYHKIKNGETLTSIAKKYHVTVKQIKQWNRLKSDMIRAGEKLKIIRK